MNASFMDLFSKFWSLQMFVIDGQPMTIGKLITGVVLILLGWWLSKRGSEAVDRRFLSRLDLELSVRHTLKRVLYYAFLAMVTLSTLRAINVPITVFAVLGGALAIGFGFGSQNIVNNFISGIILLVERPVRVGDFIELEGLQGTVEVIGIRATQIRTTDNRQVIVPNSFFLEKPVVNWTLDDSVIRRKVTIGVDYSSSPQKVKQILLQMAGAHASVLKDPQPLVVFADFGDNALIFELYFWIRMGGSKVGVEVDSDLRFEIESELRTAGISVPFPQRDIHLLTQRPLKVEITKGH